ncbi:MAG: DUF6923 family protein [Clostridium sp.]|uniref:DUF6923 family protein n=1 Tax=Clostridium sp. TaxID=1506 RepID=UPI003F2AE875
MPSTITGTIFNDINKNGVLNAGEPGISGVRVVLYLNGICIQGNTNGSGVYTFSNITIPGTYRVYETVTTTNASCPPTIFTQPNGFNYSNTPRFKAISITQAQINSNTSFGGNNFGHSIGENQFVCDFVAYQVADSPSNLYKINLVTGNTVNLGSLSNTITFNAAGYNPKDNFGYIMDNNILYRIQSDKTMTQIGIVNNLPNAGYNVGAISPDGYMYIVAANGSRYYVIDLSDQNKATYGQLVDPVNFNLETSNFGTAIGTPNFVDWTYNTDNFLYAISGSNLVRINPRTGAKVNFPLSGVPGGGYGAAFSDGDGNLYFINNGTGNVYRIKTPIVGGVAIGSFFSEAQISNFNDGFSCSLAKLLIDFGDAPNTSNIFKKNNYRTLLENNGPRHAIFSTIKIGNSETSEQDGLQNSTATGDVDDGVTLPLNPICTLDKTYTFTISVFNNTGSVAKLYSWIDLNNDGIFEGNESYTVTVASSTLPQVKVINYNVPYGTKLKEGYTFIRTRLTTDTLANSNTGDLTKEDTRSYGPASDGEVEDYLINICKTTVPSTCTCPIPTCEGGSCTEYEMLITPISTPISGQYGPFSVSPSVTYTVSSIPEGGVVNLNSSTGSFNYSPYYDYVGIDRFEIKASNYTSFEQKKNYEVLVIGTKVLIDKYNILNNNNMFCTDSPPCTVGCNCFDCTTCTETVCDCSTTCTYSCK